MNVNMDTDGYKTFEWTVEYAIDVNTNTLLYNLREWGKTKGLDLHKMDELRQAIKLTVSDYLAGEDDEIYYAITPEVVSQIEKSLEKDYLFGLGNY